MAETQSRCEPYEIDYPIIFLYRHCVELYLKAILTTPPETHDLNRLMELLEKQVGKKVAAWVGGRVRDFHKIDQISDLFRYPGGPWNELWIDLHQLKTVMDRLVEAFERQLDADIRTRPGR